jgi:hypothetical protein
MVAAMLAAGAVGMAPGVAAAAGPTGPVAEWTFDEADGSTATDVVGGLDGVLGGGVTRISSGVPQGTGALQFDGVDDLVTVAAAPALEQAGPFSVATWFRMSPPPAFTSQALLAMGNHGCGGSWGVEMMYMNPLGEAMLTTWPGSLHVGTSGPGYSWYDGRWHLLAYTVDPDAQQSSLMIDGHRWVQAWPGPDSIRYGGTDLVSPDLHIGGLGAPCQNLAPFAGALDDIRVWDRILSQAEILGQLPAIETTTDLHICVESSCPDAPSITSAITDQRLLYRVHVAPWPALGGDVSWYRSRDLGPETLFATTPLRIDDMTGYQFTYQEPGTLEPGDYTIRASWPGAAPWQASSSAAMPLTITRRPVTMEAAATPVALLPGEGTMLTARVAVANPPASYAISGSVDFYETSGGTQQLLGASALTYTGNPTWNTATFAVQSVSAGTHTYEARFTGTSTLAANSVPLSVTAGPQLSAVGLTLEPNPSLNTEHATAQVWLSTFRNGDLSGGLPAPTGTLMVKAQPAGTVIGTIPVTGNGQHTLELPLYPVGTRQISVEYSGDSNFLAASSAVETLSIVQDVTDAVATVQYTTFYPYKDGFRDTDAIRGTRNEPASVAIRVVSPTGRTVKTGSIASGTGAYSFTWTGRNSAGTMLASGTYTVTQTLTGADGSKLVVVSKVVLSAKRLYTTSKSLTQTFPTQVDFAGGGWAGWQFTLPSAAVYRKLVFAVDAKSNKPVGRFGPQSYTKCSADLVGPGCVSPVASLTTTRGWRSVTGSVSTNRNGRQVRIFVWQPGGTVWVWRARVTVTYAILK